MTTGYLEDVLEDVQDEAERARGKFGEQATLGEQGWLAVLAEEFGEVAKDVTQRTVPPFGPHIPTVEELRAELVQVGATAARFVRALDLAAGRMTRTPEVEFGEPTRTNWTTDPGHGPGPVDVGEAAAALTAYYAPTSSPKEA